MIGTLYLISTPIGNLADLTLRAISTLRDVNIVAAEDPEKTVKLLKHYHISSQLTSYHNTNKEEKTGVLIHRMEQGETVALVVDEGTPLICDPGHFLVNEVIKAGIPIVPIPGPSALLTALTASGLPTDAFVFLGICPTRSTARQALLDAMQADSRTQVMFIRPGQLATFLRDLHRVLGNRKIVLGKQLTGEYEAFVRGKVHEVLKSLSMHSNQENMTLVIQGATTNKRRNQIPS